MLSRNRIRLLTVLLISALLLLIMSAAHAELSKGSRGEEVRILQQRLSELGYSVGTVDGDFGGKTESAILRFQEEHSLEKTGELDAETYALLFPDDYQEESSKAITSRNNVIMLTADEEGRTKFPLKNIDSSFTYYWRLSGIRPDGLDFAEFGRISAEDMSNAMLVLPAIYSEAGTYGPFELNIFDSVWDTQTYDICIEIPADLSQSEGRYLLDTASLQQTVSAEERPTLNYAVPLRFCYSEPIEQFEFLDAYYLETGDGCIHFIIENTKPGVPYFAVLSGETIQSKPFEVREAFLGGKRAYFGFPISPKAKEEPYGPYKLQIIGGGETLEYTIHAKVLESNPDLGDFNCATKPAGNQKTPSFESLGFAEPKLILDLPDGSAIERGGSEIRVDAKLYGFFEEETVRPTAVLKNADTGKVISQGTFSSLVSDEPIGAQGFMIDENEYLLWHSGVTNMCIYFDSPKNHKPGTEYVVEVTAGELSASSRFTFAHEDMIPQAQFVRPCEGEFLVGKSGSRFAYEMVRANYYGESSLRLIFTETDETVVEIANSESEPSTAFADCAFSRNFEFESGKYILSNTVNDFEDSVGIYLFNEEDILASSGH